MMKAVRIAGFAVLVVAVSGCRSNDGKKKSNETKRGDGDANQATTVAAANPLHATEGAALSAAALPVGVDPLTGVYRLQQTDLSVRFRSVEIDVTREFSSLFVGTEPHNGGWLFYPFQKRIRFVGDNDRFFLQDGADMAEFVRTAGKNEYVSPQMERIVPEGEGFLRKRPDGTAEAYDRAGKLIRIDSPTGASVRFAYLNERLDTVSANDKELLRIRYDGKGRIEHLTAYNGAAASYGYDDRGRLVSATNEDNILTRFRYDSRGRLSHVGFQTGDTVGITYEENSGRVLRVVRRSGVTEYAYKEGDKGQVRRVIVTRPTGRETYVIRRNGGEIEHTDLLGHRTIRRYENGRLISQVDARQHTVSYKYDSLGRLVAITSPDGSKAGFAYLQDTSLPTRQTQRDGSTVKYSYDGNLRVTRVRGSGGLDVTYSYNQAGLIDTVTHGEGRHALRQQYEYDDNGRLVRETDSVGRTLRYKYDARGRMVEATGPTGATLRSRHDEHGLISDISYCGRPVRSHTVDKQLRPVESRDERGLATRFVYDENGRLKSVAYPTGAGETYEYNEHGWLIATVTSDGIRRSYKHNRLGALTAETINGRDTVSYTHDPFGRLIGLLGPHGATQWRHDNMGRPALVMLPGGERRAYAYNRAGRLIAETDGAGGLKKYRYSSAGNLVEVALPNGDRTRYSYGRAGPGLLTAVRTADDRQYAYAYDPAGRLIRERMPWGQTVELAYDKADSIIKTTSSSGAVVSYGYDRFGRHVTTASSDGHRATFEYDDKGDLVRVAGNAFEKKLRYDRFGRLVAERYPLLGKEVRYTYDKWNRRTSLEVPGHLKIAYSYDKAGRLAAIRYGQAKQIAFTYDEAGRRTKVSYPNGVAAAYAYPIDGGLSQIAWVGPSRKALEKRQYEYDAAQRVTKVTDLAGRGRRFSYDVNGQLAKVASDGGKTSFGYGRELRRVTETVDGKTKHFAYNRAGQMIQAGGVKMDYDRAGNMASKSSAGDEKKYRFDALGKLVQVQSGAGTWTYSYSPEGNRIAKSVGGKKTHYLYDGLDLLMVLDESKQPVRTFIHDPAVDAPAVMLGPSGARFYLPDRLGSIVALADKGGRITTRYVYDPFGAFTTEGEGTENPFAFTGRYYDRESGLYYYRARYYDPVLGIFLSPDPFPKAPMAPEDFAEYAYARNDPVNAKDPLGLSTYSVSEVNRIVIRDAKWYMHLQRKFGPALARHWAKSARGHMARWVLPRVVRPGQVNRALMQTGRIPQIAARTANATRIGRVSQAGRGLQGAGQAGGRTGLGGLLRRAGQRYVDSPLRQRLLQRPWSQKLLEQARKAPKATVVLTVVGSGLTGYNIGSRYIAKAHAEGRPATKAEWAMASAEASARAAASVITMGASEGAIEIGSKGSGTYRAHKALNRYARAKRRLDTAAAKKKAETQPVRLVKRSRDLLAAMKAVAAEQKRAIAKTKGLRKRARDCLARIKAAKPLAQPTTTEEDLRKTELNVDVLTAHEDDSRHLKGQVIKSHDTAKKEAGLAMLETKAEDAGPHVVAAIRAAERTTKDAGKMARIAKQAEPVKAKVDYWAAKVSAYRAEHSPAETDAYSVVREVKADIAGCAAKVWKNRAIVRSCPAKARKILRSFNTVYELVRNLEGTDKDTILDNQLAAERIGESISKSATKTDLLARDTDFVEKQVLAKVKALSGTLEKSQRTRLFVPLPRADLVADLDAAAGAAEIFAARARAFADQAKRYLASLPGGKEMLARMGGAKLPDGQTDKVDPKKKVPPKSYRWPVMLGVKPMYPTTVVRTRPAFEVKTPSGYKKLGKFVSIHNKYEERKNGFTIFMTVRKFEDEAGTGEMQKYNVARHKKYFGTSVYRPVLFKSDGTKDGFFFILWGQYTLANDRFHNAGKLKGEFVYRSRYQISFTVWPMGRWKQQVPTKPIATKLAPQLLALGKQKSAILEGHGKRVADWLGGKVTPRSPPAASRPSDGGKPSPGPEK